LWIPSQVLILVKSIIILLMKKICTRSSQKRHLPAKTTNIYFCMFLRIRENGSKMFFFTFPFFFFFSFFIQYVWDAISIIDDYSIQSFLLSFFLLIHHFLCIPLRYGMPYYAFYVVQGCTTIERDYLIVLLLQCTYVVVQYNEWHRVFKVYLGFHFLNALFVFILD